MRCCQLAPNLEHLTAPRLRLALLPRPRRLALQHCANRHITRPTPFGAPRAAAPPPLGNWKAVNAAAFVGDVLGQIAAQYKEDLAAGAERGPLAGLKQAVSEGPTSVLSGVSRALAGTAEELQGRASRLRAELVAETTVATAPPSPAAAPAQGGSGRSEAVWVGGEAGDAWGQQPRASAVVAGQEGSAPYFDVSAVAQEVDWQGGDASRSSVSAAPQPAALSREAVAASAEVVVSVTVSAAPGSAQGAASVAPSASSRSSVPAWSGAEWRERAQAARDDTEPLESAKGGALGARAGEDEDDSLDVEVTAVADEREAARVRQGQLLADRLVLWLERSTELAVDEATELLLPEALKEWRALKRFRRPLPPEFPAAMLAEFIGSAISRE